MQGMAHLIWVAWVINIFHKIINNESRPHRIAGTGFFFCMLKNYGSANRNNC